MCTNPIGPLLGLRLQHRPNNRSSLGCWGGGRVPSATEGDVLGPTTALCCVFYGMVGVDAGYLGCWTDWRRRRKFRSFNGGNVMFKAQMQARRAGGWRTPVGAGGEATTLLCPSVTLSAVSYFCMYYLIACRSSQT